MNVIVKFNCPGENTTYYIHRILLKPEQREMLINYKYDNCSKCKEKLWMSCWNYFENVRTLIPRNGSLLINIVEILEGGMNI
jgi:hypothetical protein